MIRSSIHGNVALFITLYKIVKFVYAVTMSFKSQARLIFLSLVILLVEASLQAQNTKTLSKFSLITEINHPYVYYKEGSKELTGIAFDIITELLKRADIQADINVRPWLRAIRMLDESDNSCLFIMNRTAQREAKYTWVGPMLIGNYSLYKRPDSPIVINQVSDIEDYVVIGKTDGTALKDLKKEIDFQTVYTSSDEQSAKLLFHGRGDLWATGDMDGPMAIKNLGLPMPTLAFTRNKTDLSMGCSLKLLPSTLKKLQDAHDTMSDFRNNIVKKYISAK